MRHKPVVARVLAQQDVDAAIAYYLDQDAQQAALGFIDALQQAYAHISRHPGSASSRYAHELGIPGLYSWPLKNFPYLVFYVECDDHIDIWRVLHSMKDIPSRLQEGTDSTPPSQ